jgi:xanthine dehydrogenase/oxidase
VNADDALKMEGVVDFISCKDLSPEKNIFGPVIKDEELFASQEVFHVGQMIGLIIADTEDHAREAAKYVKIQYDVKKPVVTIEVKYHICST